MDKSGSKDVWKFKIMELTRFVGDIFLIHVEKHGVYIMIQAVISFHSSNTARACISRYHYSVSRMEGGVPRAVMRI